MKYWYNKYLLIQKKHACMNDSVCVCAYVKKIVERIFQKIHYTKTVICINRYKCKSKVIWQCSFQIYYKM